MSRRIPRIVDKEELERLKTEIQGVSQQVRDQADDMFAAGMLEPLVFLGDSDFDGLWQAGFVGKDHASFYMIYKDRKVRLSRKT